MMRHWTFKRRQMPDIHRFVCDFAFRGDVERHRFDPVLEAFGIYPSELPKEDKGYQRTSPHFNFRKPLRF